MGQRATSCPGSASCAATMRRRRFSSTFFARYLSLPRLLAGRRRYRVTLLSLRQADDEFLPGEMQLAAPTVLVVSDRRRPVRLGIHLRREGQSIVLGKFGPTGSFSA